MGGLRLTEQEFTTVKQLLAKGYDGKKVAEIVGRGTGTVSTIKNSKDYTDFRERQDRLWKQQKSKKHVEQPKLPLDKPKKTTLDLREDIALKFNSLTDAMLLYKMSTPIKKSVHFDEAVKHLEEARLWLKEAL